MQIHEVVQEVAIRVPALIVLAYVVVKFIGVVQKFNEMMAVISKESHERFAESEKAMADRFATITRETAERFQKMGIDCHESQREGNKAIAAMAATLRDLQLTLAKIEGTIARANGGGRPL